MNDKKNFKNETKNFNSFKFLYDIQILFFCLLSTSTSNLRLLIFLSCWCNWSLFFFVGNNFSRLSSLLSWFFSCKFVLLLGWHYDCSSYYLNYIWIYYLYIFINFVMFFFNIKNLKIFSTKTTSNFIIFINYYLFKSFIFIICILFI